MPRRLSALPTPRSVSALLAAMALALSLLMPPGFMPGASLAQPIMLCGGNDAPMAAMPEMDSRHGAPGKAGKGMADHSCPFAAAATTPLTPSAVLPDLPPAPPAIVAFVAPTLRSVPGRGLAAPPPPSHAPPLLSA